MSARTDSRPAAASPRMTLPPDTPGLFGHPDPVEPAAMPAIIPFQFESQTVRMQVDDAGLPWFNATDVCDALEMGNPSQAIKSHVDTDDLQKLEVIDNLGRTQRANHVNESGLYALILGSTKDAAKRFKRWVTSEVLPTLRRAGTYTAPAAPAVGPSADVVQSLLMIGEAVARVPGVKAGMAMACTLNAIEKATGMPAADLRLALPSDRLSACTLNATGLGNLMGLSGRAVNTLLAESGLQVRNARNEWELTEPGREWGESLPFSRGGHSGYQILWNPSVKTLLAPEATA